MMLKCVAVKIYVCDMWERGVNKVVMNSGGVEEGIRGKGRCCEKGGV